MVQHKSRVVIALWGLAGLCVLAFSIGSWLISDQFVYGQGHAERPIPTLFGLYLVGCLGFILGVALLKFGGDSRRRFLWILIVGFSARLFLLPSNLIQENDCYRYVLDGECVKHMVNPYRYAPEEIIEYTPTEFNGELQSPEAQLILSRIGYPDIPTIYPPLAQLCFAVGAGLTPWRWLGQRLVFLAFDIGTILLILGILKRLEKSLSWSVVYVWNPLVIKEIANSAHLDSLVGFCILLVLLFLEMSHRKEPYFFAALSGLSFGAAVLAKLYPLILLPLCMSYLLNGKHATIKKRWSSLAIFLVTSTCVVTIGYLPFIGVGIGRVTEGLRTYNAEWVNNEGAFFIVSYLIDRIVPVPTFPIDRLAANSLVGLFVIGLSVKLYRGDSKFENVIRSFQIIFLGWFLLLPAVFPWYAIGLIAVSALRPKGVIVLLSCTLGMYYLLFMIDYRGYPSHWRGVVQSIEHGLIWGWILIILCLKIPARYSRNHN